jgi:hypothetical protein
MSNQKSNENIFIISFCFNRKLLKYSGAVIRFVFVITNNLYCIPTYLLWMIMLLPLKKFNPNLYYRIEGKIFHWLLATVAMWSSMAGYEGKFKLKKKTNYDSITNKI